MNGDWLVLVLGLAAGAGVALAVMWAARWRADQATVRGLEALRAERDQQTAAVVDRVEARFAAVSRTIIEDFLRLAQSNLGQQLSQGEQTLETKKKLIDARLEEMAAKLGDLNRSIQALEQHRAETHGSLSSQIERATQATNQLHETTAKLREALANPQRRGQWGERMAEDVLRLAGFQAGVNYVKQAGIGERQRPDFSFPLPGGRRVHMDVKFPLPNYLKVLEARDERERSEAARQFLRDVRTRIREVTTREYINPADGTVDYVLVFIPNEQIYGFIHEHDVELMDDAMRDKVVLCSPITLYAILSIIRQSVETFRLERSSREVLEVLGEFRRQWGKFVEGMDALGQKLGEAAQKYEDLVNRRTRQLERELNKLDTLPMPGELCEARPASAAITPGHANIPG